MRTRYHAILVAADEQHRLVYGGQQRPKIEMRDICACEANAANAGRPEQSRKWFHTSGNNSLKRCGGLEQYLLAQRHTAIVPGRKRPQYARIRSARAADDKPNRLAGCRGQPLRMSVHRLQNNRRTERRTENVALSQSQIIEQGPYVGDEIVVRVPAKPALRWPLGRS